MWQCSYCPFTSSRKWNTQVHEKRKHQNLHHQPVEAQQPWTQQQGGRVQVLHQQHFGNHGQVNNQPHYRNVKLLDLELLKTRGLLRDM